MILKKTGFVDYANGVNKIVDTVMKYLMQFKNGEC